MDTLLAITATIIAVAAIFIAVYEARQTRKHNRLSVRPRLNFELVRSRSRKMIGIKIMNYGLGPAVVASWSVKVAGKAVNNTDDWTKPLKKHGIQKSGVEWTHMKPKGIIPAGDAVWVLGIPCSPDDMEVRNKLDKLCPGVKIDIGYRSMYEEETFTLTDFWKGVV